MNEPLVLLLLPQMARPPPSDGSIPRRPAHSRQLPPRRSRAPAPEVTPDDTGAVAPKLPSIDLDKEADLAIQEAIANAARDNGYRNLSALSPEQLRWVRGNHLEPVTPGITWKYRRVEITQGGFPIIHINDHCVAIPFLLMMVFCQIGHIEPNGSLFEHMRDPHSP